MLICLLSYGRHGFVTTSTGFVYCDKIHVYYKHLSFIVIFQTLKVSTNNTIMVKKCIFNVYVNYAKTWPLDVA